MEAPIIRDEEERDREQISTLAISRVPSAERMRVNSRNNSRVELRQSKSTYRILSTTGQQFFREPTTQTLAPIKQLERVQTAKSNANEGEMRRTRLLMDKISGKHLMELKNSKIDENESNLHN
jgi:hypothetical protein